MIRACLKLPPGRCEGVIIVDTLPNSQVWFLIEICPNPSKIQESLVLTYQICSVVIVACSILVKMWTCDHDLKTGRGSSIASQIAPFLESVPTLSFPQDFLLKKAKNKAPITTSNCSGKHRGKVWGEITSCFICRLSPEFDPGTLCSEKDLLLHRRATAMCTPLARCPRVISGQLRHLNQRRRRRWGRRICLANTTGGGGEKFPHDPSWHQRCDGKMRWGKQERGRERRPDRR